MSKSDDRLFHYFDPDKEELQWGFRAEGRHLQVGFKSEEEAHKALMKFCKENGLENAPVSKLRSGSEVCIDFDGTIYPGHPRDAVEEMPPPDPACVQTIRELYEAGHVITIFSCRSSLSVFPRPEERSELTGNMATYLEKHGIPFHRFFYDKPNYSVVIDDRACKFEGSWASVREELGMLAPSSQEKEDDGSKREDADGKVPTD